jgi:hypothetical protein
VLIMPTVTSSIVVVIHRGIDFLPGWVDKPNVLNIGMALDTVVSVAAVFNLEQRPQALCWRVSARKKKYVCSAPAAQGNDSQADELNHGPPRESGRLGAEDLLGTLLWAPDERHLEQWQPVHQIDFVPGGVGCTTRLLTGWNIAPRILLAKTSQLLMMTRAVDAGIARDMPLNLDDMHRHIGASEPDLLATLSGPVAVARKQDVNRKLALLFGGLLSAGTLRGREKIKNRRTVLPDAILDRRVRENWRKFVRRMPNISRRSPSCSASDEGRNGH